MRASKITQNENTLRDGDYFWWVGWRSERGRGRGRRDMLGSDVKLVYPDNPKYGGFIFMVCLLDRMG
ncbi:hypothetical protein ACHAWU_003660 [Discostella pseudostelligera]|uniref:Uncharacterized protein n=1 Tax=Discostella pseudostelligera TaxID=259834 RepID=A0ABD3MAW4_9STRA